MKRRLHHTHAGDRTPRCRAAPSGRVRIVRDHRARWLRRIRELDSNQRSEVQRLASYRLDDPGMNEWARRESNSDLRIKNPLLYL